MRSWKKRPYNFSAALNVDIARSAVRVATKMRGGQGLTLLDPCCGSATTAFIAAALPSITGYYGFDISPERIAGAKQNWQYLAEQEASLSLTARFDVRDATSPKPSSTGVDEEADIVVCNPPWGENVSEAFYSDREAILRQLTANKHGAVLAFITNGASRVPNRVYQEAGWQIDHTVCVATDSGSSSSEGVYVTFCRLAA